MVDNGVVKLEISNDTGFVILNNPPQNFLKAPEFISLELLQSWISDNKLKGILIKGAGRHFSAGASLEKLFSDTLNDDLESEMTAGRKLLKYISGLEIPVLASVKGVCFGGGLEIALSSHIRVCHPGSLFAFPEVNNNLMPGLGGISMLSENVNKTDSLRLVLGGDMINADEALSTGLVDVVTDDPDLYCETLLSKMTTDRSIRLINFVMRAVHNTSVLSKEEALREETKMFCELARDEGKRRI